MCSCSCQLEHEARSEPESSHSEMCRHFRANLCAGRRSHTNPAWTSQRTMEREGAKKIMSEIGCRLRVGVSCCSLTQIYAFICCGVLQTNWTEFFFYLGHTEEASKPEQTCLQDVQTSKAAEVKQDRDSKTKLFRLSLLFKIQVSLLETVDYLFGLSGLKLSILFAFLNTST